MSLEKPTGPLNLAPIPLSNISLTKVVEINNEKFYKLEIADQSLLNKLEKYDSISFHFKKNDNKYIVQNMGGIIFYNEIDLFVLPSYYEASACVLMEAWATDTPIVSIKKQGIAELIPIKEIDNLLADEKSPESLKEKVEKHFSL